jgi:APA family basic amino acid/polyamine antiporter
MQAIFGSPGASIMALAIVIATFGCNNGLILAGARVYYAMARDALFFARVGEVNARRVPAIALVVQGVWASLLVLPRTVTVNASTGATTYGNVYTQLLEYIISADLVFYALMVGAVIVLRRRAAERPRPYKTPGYPVVPLVYIALAALLVIDLAYLAPATAGVGYVIVLTGIPAYALWRRSSLMESRRAARRAG